MARVETRAVAAELEWVDPSEIVQAAVLQVEPAVSDRHVSIDVQSNKAMVRLDPRLTSSALAHVVENAAHYSPPGSPIAIAVTLGSGELRISVRDRGRGIAPQDLDQIFERFYRGVGARRQRFGTGMGLAIARGLLAAEGGRVWAENDPGGGAVFTIAVPVESRTTAALEEESL